MLSMLARLVIATPKRLLAAVLLITVVAAAFGATVAEHLGAAGFQDPGSASSRGLKVLTTTFGQGDMDLTLVVRAPGSVWDPLTAAAGHRLVDDLRDPNSSTTSNLLGTGHRWAQVWSAGTARPRW